MIARQRMPEFLHQRHKPPTPLARPRELLVVCSPMRSKVNLSRIVRTASCCAVRQVVACGSGRIDPAIARVPPEEVSLEVRRSLEPFLKKLKLDEYQLVGLEQATHSENLHNFRFQCRTALVIGNERLGLPDDLLKLMDHVVEIPVYGLPYSYNVATAAGMAMYEYCRQFPEG